MISHISPYDFSEEMEKKIIETLPKKPTQNFLK